MSVVDPLSSFRSRQSLPQGTTDALMSRLFPEPPDFQPAQWIRNNGGYIWSKQDEICDSVRDNRYTAVKSCHDAGKSFIASEIILAWADTYKHDGFVVWTAPTFPQVNAIIGREIKAAINRYGLDLHLTGSLELRLPDGTLVGYGRKPADHDSHGFQGIHAKYVLVVIDEGCGVEQTLFTAALALATNENARIMTVGNPDDPAAYFFEVHEDPKTAWKSIRIDGLETPNMTEEAVANFPALYAYMVKHDIPFSTEAVPEWLRPMLLSPEWADEALERWGENSPLFISKVRGEFPDVASTALVSPKMIRQAWETHLPGSNTGVLGVDVARYGMDETVIYRNRGGQIRLEHTAPKASTMRTAGEVMRRVKRMNWDIPVVVDVIGVGAGVVDRLAEQEINVLAFNSSEKASNPARYKNKRSEMYYLFRELLEQGAIDLDPEDTDLAAELQAHDWTLDSSGRIVVGSKDDVKKKLGRSPDRADAAVMTLAVQQGRRPRDAEALDTSNSQAMHTADLLDVQW